MVWHNVKSDPRDRKNGESYLYRSFVKLLSSAAEALQVSQEAVVLFILTAEDEKSRFESCR
eukprot:7183244-Alexandrium_andersonii.AAC.1